MKYGSLRTIAAMLKILAWLILVLGVIVSILTGAAAADLAEEELRAGGATTAAVYIIGGIISSLLGFLLLLATSYLIYLFIDVEQNTRETAERLKQGS